MARHWPEVHCLLRLFSLRRGILQQKPPAAVGGLSVLEPVNATGNERSLYEVSSLLYWSVNARQSSQRSENNLKSQAKL